MTLYLSFPRLLFWLREIRHIRKKTKSLNICNFVKIRRSEGHFFSAGLN